MPSSDYKLHRMGTGLTLVLLWLPLSLMADELSSTDKRQINYSLFVDWLSTLAEDEAIPGGAFAIVSGENVLHMQSWGVRDIENSDSISFDSIFRLASMSKPFAGTAAGILVRDQQQSWDAPLTDLFANLRLGNGESSRAITLKHIVSHSTGLMPHSFSNLLDAGVPYEKIKLKFDEIPTVCAPGRCYGYQNVVFSMVSDVIELRTGSSYEQFIQQRIFEPLGMLTASIGMDPYLNGIDRTSPHRKSLGRWQATTTNAAYYTVAPASGVNASIIDMSIWLRANLGGFPEVLSSDALAEFHEPVIPTPFGNYFNNWSGVEKAYYAIGWRVFDYRGIRAIHHGGGVRGYRSEMVFVPELNIGMVLLMNAETNLANDMVPTFLDTLFGDSPAPRQPH